MRAPNAPVGCVGAVDSVLRACLGERHRGRRRVAGSRLAKIAASAVIGEREGCRAPVRREAAAGVRAAQPRSLARCAQLPAVLLRPAGLGGRHVDADRGAVVPGAPSDEQRDGARAFDRGAFPADVPVRPCRWAGGRSDGQAAGSVRHPDPLRPAGRRLRRPDRDGHHSDVDGVRACARARRRQRTTSASLCSPSSRCC